MRPLKNACVNVLYVFYDFETTQNSEYTDEARLNAPNLVSVQQMCSCYEDVGDVERDTVQFGKRKHSFWHDPVGYLPSYLTEPRP